LGEAGSPESGPAQAQAQARRFDSSTGLLCGACGDLPSSGSGSRLLRDRGGPTMNLEHEFNFVATLKPPVQIGAGPFGTRNVVEITGGTIEGKRLKGKILSGGSDWMLIGPDGYARLDVRSQFLTDDGVALYGHYTGLVEMNQKVVDALTKGGSTDYGDHYFRTTPRFETGDPRYAWLNQSIFLAEGRLGPGRVEYKVYRVA
jgi:hypothetical protein